MFVGKLRENQQIVGQVCKSAPPYRFPHQKHVYVTSSGVEESPASSLHCMSQGMWWRLWTTLAVPVTQVSDADIHLSIFLCTGLHSSQLGERPVNQGKSWWITLCMCVWRGGRLTLTHINTHTHIYIFLIGCCHVILAGLVLTGKPMLASTLLSFCLLFSSFPFLPLPLLFFSLFFSFFWFPKTGFLPVVFPVSPLQTSHSITPALCLYDGALPHTHPFPPHCSSILSRWSIKSLCRTKGLPFLWC